MSIKTIGEAVIEIERAVRREFVQDIKDDACGLMLHPSDGMVHFAFEYERGIGFRKREKISRLVADCCENGWDDDADMEAIIADLKKATNIAERELAKWRSGNRT